MLKRIIYILAFLLLLIPSGCRRDMMETDFQPLEDIPDGTPITMLLPFYSIEQYDVDINTKAEASPSDESRIHDLYVMIFDNTPSGKVSDENYTDSPRKIYGRYFSYDHLKGGLAALSADDNECWYVKNKVLDDGAEVKTEGAVKVSTISCSNAILIVIANVRNSVTNLDGKDGLERLREIRHLKELQDVQVCLEQDIVNRKDLFLMTGELSSINTANLRWNQELSPSEYNSTYRVPLIPVDAKVKFRVKCNPTYISEARPVYWQVCSTPDRCYLFTKDKVGGYSPAPSGIDYFETQQYYFEGEDTEEVDTDGDGIDDTTYTYYTFCFYMLENDQKRNKTAEKYYQRELREKLDSGESGYKGKTGSESGAFGDHFVENGDWKFAPTFGTYVCFDLVLTLTDAGIAAVGEVDTGGYTITQALTSDAIFTVHLGDFVNSGDRTLKDGTAISGSDFDNYETKRGHCYTYTVTINNTTNIYAEVKNDEEIQSGQEGFLLLTDTEIINADCHYEYHQLCFNYRSHLDQGKFSWYVKTPFGEGEPKLSKNLLTGEYTYDATGLDYKWVMFGVNKTVLASTDPGYNPSLVDPLDSKAWYDNATSQTIRPYTLHRHAYPGDDHYHPEWTPGEPNPSTHEHMVTDDEGVSWKAVPDLMDITQLIQYIFYQTQLEDSTGSSDFIYDSGSAEAPVIRVTAFIDEYYYDKDPLHPDAPLDPDLWRKFVNANPREMHILSDAEASRDRKSDVIMSSHSIIQQSIQTIYNIYSSNLRSLWGTEHQDEMRKKSSGWTYWPSGLANEKVGEYNTAAGKENGRLNSAFIWGFYKDKAYSNEDKDYTRPGYGSKPEWTTFLNYDVLNNTPELLEQYHGMAFSCLTRNRDNNGNHKIDRDEVRWYLAACNQLIGMWVGNESLSVDARLYRPEPGQWRAHILSSSGKRVCWSEEGGGATDYSQEASKECWGSYAAAAAGESVRCLRNVGTYDKDGVVTDISGAPYNIQADQYFTITPDPTEGLNGDLNDAQWVNGNPVVKPTHADKNIRYTFSFDRINPKSLRELTQTDLPYGDQYSINNCVYLQMVTQSRADELQLRGPGDVYPEYDYPYAKDLGELNKEVDEKGFNYYCPPGYRFPGQVEMLLMSEYLPRSFFMADPNNDDAPYPYPGTDVWFPTRTYFDRGCYGLDITGFEYDNEGKAKATTREQSKVGWAYSMKSQKNKTAKKKGMEGNAHHFEMRYSRCVADINMTGTISGGILMKDVLYPGDEVPLSFSFYSSGSAFISASLKLCYSDPEGHYHERDIPIQKTPSGLQFLYDQTITMPKLTVESLGITDAQLKANPALRNMTFKITMRNAYQSKTFEQPFTLGNPLEGTFSVVGNNELLPDETKEMNFNITSLANTCHLADVTLKLQYKNAANPPVDVEKTLTIPALTAESFTYVHLNEAISIPSVPALDLLPENLPRNASLEFVVTDQGGSSLSIPISEVNNHQHLILGTNPAFDGFRIRATVADTRVTFHENYRASLYYSTSMDGGEHWNVPTSSAIILPNVGDEIWVLGRRENYKNASAEGKPTYGSPLGNPLFSTASNKLVTISGDIMSLLCRPDEEDYEHPENWTFGSSMPDDAFNGTFSRASSGSLTYINIDPERPLILPAYTAVRCYKGMFRKCISLTHAPDLPATAANMSESCYNSMFRECTSLRYIRCYFSCYNGGGYEKANYNRSSAEFWLDKWTDGIGEIEGTLYCHPDMVTYFTNAKNKANGGGYTGWYGEYTKASMPKNWTATEWTPAPSTP